MHVVVVPIAVEYPPVLVKELAFALFFICDKVTCVCRLVATPSILTGALFLAL